MERTEVELAAQEDSPRTTGGFSNSADLLGGVILETNTGFVSEQCSTVTQLLGASIHLIAADWAACR